MYKILNKTIVNRLRPLMVKLTQQNQIGFIPGRDITDNIMVTQEVVHSLKNFRGNKWEMILKIDLEKAYDRLNWDFLWDMLLIIGLPSWLVDVILHCVTSTPF